MQSAETQFRTYLKSKGFRFTNERRLILQEIMKLHDHFDPEDLVVKLRKKGTGVSRTSVYRTLPLLVESGIVHKTPCDRMNGHYEHVFGHGHHDHLLCLGCGRIIEFYDNSIEKLQERIVRKENFEMTGHRLVISGFCEDCAKG